MTRQRPDDGLEYTDFLKIFIVAPYILIYVEFTHQQMHFY